MRGLVIWLTGLPAAGKTTLAERTRSELMRRGRSTLVLDGDRVRAGLCSDLGFSRQDRRENLRRVAEVARLCADAGVIALVALISPYREDRARAREICGADFVEVFVSTALEVCEKRDPKGLYAKARAGSLPGLTGVGAPYEPPPSADVVVDCEQQTPEASAAALIAALERRGVL